MAKPHTPVGLPHAGCPSPSLVRPYFLLAPVPKMTGLVAVLVGQVRPWWMVSAALWVGLHMSVASLRAGGPESLVLVVNERSAASLAVANHYIQLRDIPGQNVVYLPNVPDMETLNLDRFRDEILKPVLNQINERRLGHIDYIVYSADFPTAINIEPHISKLRDRLGNLPQGLYHPWASINSLTYFFHYVLADDPSYLLLDANWYMRRSTSGILDKVFVGDEQQAYDQAIKQYRQGDYAAAAQSFADLARRHRQQAAVHYYLARSLARNKQSEQAIDALVQAARSGWCYRAFTREDSAFEDLKDNSLFSRIVEQIADDPFDFLPTRGFDSLHPWGPNGWPNGSMAQGKRFVLSMVLAATRNRGLTLEEALKNLTVSAGADATFPAGKFYFTETRNVRSTTRQRQFASTIAALQRLGMQGEAVKTGMPMGKEAVLGATTGTHVFNWTNSGSRIVPGAICENLTSYGGQLFKDSGHTPLTHFLRHGAAASSGTVFEPLAVAAKFPHARIHVHYAKGCTLAESYYQSVHSPFQLLIVGDPLCQPWATRPRFNIEGIRDAQVVKSDLQLTVTPQADGPRIARFELFLDGRRVLVGPVGRPATLPINELSDGFHELRVVAVDASLIATRASRTLSFTVERSDRRVSLKSDATRIGQQQSLALTVTASFGSQVTVLQNQRVLATIEGQSGSVTLPGAKLGVGHSQLVAVVNDGGLTVSSTPIGIVVR